MYLATCEYDAAHVLFKPYEMLQLAEGKLDLQGNIATAATVLKTQQETAETRRANAEQHAVNELRRFKVKIDDELAVLKDALDTIEKEEQIFLSTSKSHLETVRKQNNIEDTVEHQDIIKTRRKKEETYLAYQSFDELLHVINVLGALYTGPLRYTIKLSSGKLLQISKIEIDGKWSSMAKDGKLSAHITAVIGFVPVVLHVSFDIGDILGFFKELWTEIGKLMNSVGGTIKHFFEEGLKAAEEGFEIALVEGKRFIEDADKALDKVENVIEEFGKDLGHIAEDVVDRAEDLGKEVARSTDESIDDADRAFKTTLTDTQHFAEKSAETIVHAAEDLQHGAETVGRELDHTFHQAAEDIQHGAQTVAHEIDHTVTDAAKDFGHTIHNVAEKTEEIANKTVEAIGDTFSDIGRGITSLWRY